MNTIIRLFFDAVDLARAYAREACTGLVLIALILGGNYILHVTQRSRDTQRAVVNEFARPQAPSTSAPTTKSCDWLHTNGTTTLCVQEEDPL